MAAESRDPYPASAETLSERSESKDLLLPLLTNRQLTTNGVRGAHICLTLANVGLMPTLAPAKNSETEPGSVNRRCRGSTGGGAAALPGAPEPVLSL